MIKNSVFIATSLDGFIAGKNNELEWLSTFPEINQIDTGFEQFTSQVDAILMGRNTFEVVANFEGEWFYKKPVFVWSNSLKEIPDRLKSKVFLVQGNISEILSKIHGKGFYRLYIDGGKTIQTFLKKDLIDEMVITTIPVLLGSGIRLFGDLPKELVFECINSTRFLGKVVQNHYVRSR
ncbi:dihydrofolate reductase family protein [Algoriphagus machipongonensis]|uniref:Riboflavin biosynthesis protein RibD n=1 Tax=Algoriphagus machipongonensis TaxID=388413 RepID=A3I2R0_9BACT|nr:dihydrofolate reductase family protein [Algoriphagus machipongonensis]EAZ79364.1 riboflavin biosynthesis protein RibD [Algoriphagus machipongonensis]